MSGCCLDCGNGLCICDYIEADAITYGTVHTNDSITDFFEAYEKLETVLFELKEIINRHDEVVEVWELKSVLEKAGML